MSPLDDSTSDARKAPRLDAELWRRILTHLRYTHPSLNRTWFESMVPRQLSNGVIHVTCDTLAQLNFLTGQCQQPFTAAAQAVTSRLSVVMFHCDQLRAGGVLDDFEQQNLPLNPDYTFDNFIVGPGNQLAHAAALAVSDRLASDYNPLFIHGGVGLGKTHLLQAICQRLLERDPSLRIVYISCDSFINQITAALAAGAVSQIRYRFRNADVLVIDDIHFFAGRERTQEEFFHTFNTLHQQQKQIILSADAPPNQIPEIEERLVSRFNWGMVAPIEKPCFETRVAILQKKARLRGLDISDEVVCYIAAKVENNTRELEGAITKVQALASLNDGRIDIDLARKSLGDNGQEQAKKRISIQQILDIVTTYYGVRIGDLQGKKRNKSIAFPRQVCMFLARRHTRYSLQEIGGYFGGRDHTTVLHGVKTVTAQVGNDIEVQRQVGALENLLGAPADNGTGRNGAPKPS